LIATVEIYIKVQGEYPMAKILGPKIYETSTPHIVEVVKAQNFLRSALVRLSKGEGPKQDPTIDEYIDMALEAGAQLAQPIAQLVIALIFMECPKLFNQSIRIKWKDEQEDTVVIYALVDPCSFNPN